jgi:O-antigen/teichoic acid export membrane protein
VSEGPDRGATVDAAPLARVASDGLVYLLAALLGRALGLVMVPVYTHRLGPADYGVLELLNTVDLVVIAAFSAPLADPVYRHVHDAPDARSRDAIIATALLAVAAAGAVTALLGVALAPALARALFGDAGRAELLALTFAAVTFQAVTEVPLAVRRGAGEARSAARWALARTALGLGCNLALIVGAGLGVRGAALATLAASAVIAVALSVDTLRRTGLRFEPAALARMLRFGWPLLPGALALTVLGRSRAFALNARGTPAEVGVWALGYGFGALLVAVLGHPLRVAWTAHMYRVWDAPDGLGPARYRRGGTWLVAALAWGAAALTAFAPELTRWMAPPAFAAAALVTPAVAWGYVLRELAEYFRNGLLVARRPRAIAVVEPGLAAVDVALGWALVARAGLAGAAATSVLVFGLYALAMHAAARRALPVGYAYGPMLACAGLGLGLGLAGWWVRTGVTALDVGVKLALVATVPLAQLRWVLREPDDRAVLAALRARGLRAVGR